MPKPKLKYPPRILQELPKGSGMSSNLEQEINYLLEEFYEFCDRSLLNDRDTYTRSKQDFTLIPKRYLTHLLQSIKALYDIFDRLPYEYFLNGIDHAINWIEYKTPKNSPQILEGYYLKAVAILEIGAKIECDELKCTRLSDSANKYYEKAVGLNNREYSSRYMELATICRQTIQDTKLEFLQESLIAAQLFFQEQAGTTCSLEEPSAQQAPTNCHSSIFHHPSLRLRTPHNFDEQYQPLLSPQSPPVKS